MSKLQFGKFGADYELWDADHDTGIRVEKTADDDTVRFDAGGVADLLKITSTLFNFNDDQNDVSVAFHSEDTRNLLYINGTAGADGIGFGTSNAQFTTTSGFRRSRSLYIKPDAASYNNIAIGIYSTDALRGTDFGSIRARGTEDVPTILQNSDWLHQYLVYGYDGTGFHPCAGFRYEVADTPSAGVMPSLVKFQTTDSAGNFSTRLTINKELTGIGNGIVSPNSGLQIDHSLALKVQNSVPTGYNTSHDTILGVVTNSTPITVNIPTTERVTGRILVIVDRSGNAATNNITIDPEGTTTINGKSTYVINQNYGSVVLYCGGSNWFVMGSSRPAAKTFVTKTSAYTITLNDNVVFCDGSSGAFTVSLPTAASASGYEFNVVRTGATGTITIDPNGTETISGDTTLDLTSQWDSVVFMSNGTNWIRTS